MASSHSIGIRAAASALLSIATVTSAGAARMPPDHWIGPRISPTEYLASNQGLYALDEAGILVTIYRDRHDQVEPRREYNPAFIANYAITACRTYLATQDKATLATARRQLDWLLTHGQPIKRGDITASMYPYSFDWVKFELKAPWVSAFAQSLVGVAFACGADATGASSYLEGAKQAFNALRIPVADGGVTTFTAGGAWFEEAAKADYPSIKILNGHLTAAEGLKNFLDWHPDPVYQSLWQQHLLAVRRHLPLYDAGFLSYYAQYPVGKPHQWEPSGRVGYNATHIVQLSSLYQASGWPIFLKYALKFAEYETPNLRITTAGSTAADTNGPDRINMVMGNDYWSHGTFPTWALVDMGDVFEVGGMHIVAHTERSAPRRFRIESSVDGREYRALVTRFDNRKVHAKLSWPFVRARYLRLTIHSDNGNENVTLKGLHPIRRQPYGAVVSGPMSMSVGNMPALALQEAGWAGPREGWLAFRRDALPRGVSTISFSPARAGSITLSAGSSEERLEPRSATKLACADDVCHVDLPDPARNNRLVLVRWSIPSPELGPVKVKLR